MSDKPTLSRKAASALQTEGAETAAKESTARTDKPAAVQPAGIDAKPAEAEVKSEHTAVKKTAVRRSTASKKTITKTVKSAKSVKTVKAVKVSASSTASLESAPPPLPPVEGVPDLSDPLLYINRELNWIEFDRKVLEEACDLSVPLLEQLKFLAIFHNNLDEFFMVRVANIIRQYKMGAASTSADGLPPVKQLAEIRRRVLGMLARAQNHWKNKLAPELAKKDIAIRRWKNLSAKQKTFLEGYFDNEIYPILTPQAIDAGHPFPTISNLSLNFIVELEAADGSMRYARLKCPNNMPRFIFVPRTKESAYAELGFNSSGRDDDIILLEDLIREHLGKLFPGPKSSSRAFSASPAIPTSKLKRMKLTTS